MPAIQSLKKQLRGVRSTQKLTKAMRTVATVKLSRLSSMYLGYREYGRQCRRLVEQFGGVYRELVRAADPEAPAAVVVMAANKGMCGSYNAELLRFAEEELEKLEKPWVVPCGKKAVAYFRSRGVAAAREVVLEDVPDFAQSAALLDELIQWRREGKVSRVYLIYARYVNMLTQTPAIRELFLTDEATRTAPALLVPDRGAVLERTGRSVFHGMFYRMVLEAALGTQAATLMTMRSAYDTATEYVQALEGEINRMRQNSVTADVIETSSERAE